MIIKNKLPYLVLLCLLLIHTPASSLGTARDESVNEDSEGDSPDTEEEPIHALTENDEKVLLYSDGTWEYAPVESTESKNSNNNRKINTNTIHTPTSANEVIRGKVVNYKILYNKNKWEILSENLNEMTEYSLLHRDKNAYVMVIPEAESIAMEDFRDIVLDNARRVSKKVKILEEEERTVNNSKLVMLNLKAEIEGKSFIYLYYIYSGEKKSIQVIGFTTEELYPQYKQDMEDFLNGFEAAPKPEKNK